MSTLKVQTNLRLTPAARAKLEKLSDAWGISQADVVELLIRQADPKQFSPKHPIG